MLSQHKGGTMSRSLLLITSLSFLLSACGTDASESAVPVDAQERSQGGADAQGDEGPQRADAEPEQRADDVAPLRSEDVDPKVDAEASAPEDVEAPLEDLGEGPEDVSGPEDTPEADALMNPEDVATVDSDAGDADLAPPDDDTSEGDALLAEDALGEGDTSQAADALGQGDTSQAADAIAEEDAPCVASCGQAECGDDGCGGSCGSCGAESECVAGSCTLVVLTLAEQIEALLVDELGLSELTNAIDLSEVEAQAEAFPGSVGFMSALEQAMTSFLSDDDDLESPLGVASFVAEVTWEPDNPEGQTFEEATLAVLIDHLNRSSASISLVPIGQTAEYGESVTDNWVFFLTIDELSDHLYWAIVDRQGVSATYNYGFN